MIWNFIMSGLTEHLMRNASLEMDPKLLQLIISSWMLHNKSRELVRGPEVPSYSQVGVSWAAKSSSSLFASHFGFNQNIFPLLPKRFFLVFNLDSTRLVALLCNGFKRAFQSLAEWVEMSLHEYKSPNLAKRDFRGREF